MKPIKFRYLSVLSKLWIANKMLHWRTIHLHTINIDVVERIPFESIIRFGPGEEYESRFKIHEGAEVRIEEKRDKR